MSILRFHRNAECAEAQRRAIAVEMGEIDEAAGADAFWAGVEKQHDKTRDY